MESIKLKTVDNLEIELNHYNNGFNTVVIIIHGWFMTKDSKPFRSIAESFSNLYDVITFDCRGHGKSEGKYSFTIDERLDLDSIIKYAKTKYQKIYLMGFSLGGAIAILYGSKHNIIDKIIAISAPSDFNKIENNILSPNAFIPTLKKCELKVWFSIRASFRKLLSFKKIKPIDVINKIKCPILFITGEKDPTVHAWHSFELYKKCKSKNKKYFCFKNGLHAEDLFLKNKNNFLELCTDFFKTNG